MHEEMQLKYYVYTLARPDGRVFYVGKGSGDRINAHEKEARKGIQTYKCNIIRKVWSEGGEIIKRVVFRTNDEQEAFNCEIGLIALIGQDNLTNRTIGGDGMSGYRFKRTPQDVDRIAGVMQQYWSSEDNRKAQSERVKAIMSDPVKRNRIMSARQAPEVMQRQVASWKNTLETTDLRERISESATRRYQDPAERQRLSDIHSTPEKKELFAQITAESWNDPAVREARSVGIKATRSTPESRALTSQRTKEAWAKRKAKQLADALYNADPRNFDQLTLF